METIQITLENGDRACAVVPPRTEKYGEILKALPIPQPKALLIVIGGAKNLDESTKATLLPLFSNGIAGTAAEIGAVIQNAHTNHPSSLPPLAASQVTHLPSITHLYQQKTFVRLK